jgi:hypothetical protein
MYTVKQTNAHIQIVFIILFITDMFQALLMSSSGQFTRLQGVETDC